MYPQVYRQRIHRLEAALAKLGVDPSGITSEDMTVNKAGYSEAANDELRNEIIDLRKENSFLDSEGFILCSLSLVLVLIVNSFEARGNQQERSSYFERSQ